MYQQELRPRPTFFISLAAVLTVAALGHSPSTATPPPQETLILKEWEIDLGGSDEEGSGDGVPIGQALDGGYLVAGSSMSAPSGNKTSPNFGDWDGWLAK